MMANIDVCSPNDTYIVIEQIHTKGLVVGTRTKIAPELMQVFRRVIRVCEVQGGYEFDGKPIDGNRPSNWQVIQELISRRERITSRPTGEQRLLLVYAGFKNIVTPLPKVGNLLPESWTRKYDFGTPLSAFTLGKDPIPDVRLYGNPAIHFIMPGGNPPASAFATYDGKKEKLEEIREPVMRERTLKNLVQVKPSFPLNDR